MEKVKEDKFYFNENTFWIRKENLLEIKTTI